MRIERPKQSVFRITLHAFELSAIVAAARWAAEGAEGDFPDEAKETLRSVLDNYDRAMSKSQDSDSDALSSNGQ
jgi:hypothetical protein